MADFQRRLDQKEQDIGFLRSMLSTLSEKVESLEKASDLKFGKSIKKAWHFKLNAISHPL